MKINLDIEDDLFIPLTRFQLARNNGFKSLEFEVTNKIVKEFVDELKSVGYNVFIDSNTAFVSWN